MAQRERGAKRHREVGLRIGTGTVRRRTEHLARAVEDHRGCRGSREPGDELDGQRVAPHQAGELADRRQVGRSRVGVGLLTAREVEPDGVAARELGAGGSRPWRRHRPDVERRALEPEQVARRRDDVQVGALRVQVAHQCGDGLRHPLAAVEHEQHLAVAQVDGEEVGGFGGPGLGGIDEPETRCDVVGDERGRAHGAEPDEARTLPVPGSEPLDQLVGEPGLARSARSDDRHDPVAPDGRLELLELRDAAHEASRRLLAQQRRRAVEPGRRIEQRVLAEDRAFELAHRG